MLDIGCGRGLMLVGAARRLKTGQAVGIDLWRAEDQADNSPPAAQANAHTEGVSDRIRIDTGDARQLPYPDGIRTSQSAGSHTESSARRADA